MNEKSGNRCWRRMRGRCPGSRLRAARFGAIMAFAALILILNGVPVSGATSPVVSLSGASMAVREGSGGLQAPLQQLSTNPTEPETPAEPGVASEDSRMAAVVAMVDRHGIQGFENLQRVSAIPVPNLMLDPELVVDAGTKRAAEADAAAKAAALAATAVAVSVQATVEAQEAEAASTATALAAIEEADAQAAASATAEAEVAASATAAVVATAAARASADEAAAALAAKREAAFRSVEAAATRDLDTLAAAAVASDPKMPGRMSSLLIALTPLLGGLLGFRLLRLKKEPFVLKANPVNGSTRVH
jgi:hypothetical protein